MNMNYAVAKLIAAVDMVDSRKRLQKSVFLLQQAGCELGAKFFLHHYGPYSRNVAETTDLLTRSGFLEEKATALPRGEQYSYWITANGKKKIGEFERTEEGRTALDALSPFIERFQKLVDPGQPLWILELASTVAYFRAERNLDWPEARRQAATFKHTEPGHAVMDRAERLAKDFVGSAA